MDFITENISSLLVFTIAFLIVYTVGLNLYFIHKNGFHLTVNCWFCNQNSKVLYSQRNSFECCYCFQYNGFSKDGDYNKHIEAQHNFALNTKYVSSPQNSTPKFGNNGLCNTCNRNQELKVLQLASYEPLDERNYDKEIKHFEQQLEKTYGLCDNCSKTVKRTISKQNAWIFGNRLKSFKHLNVIPEIRRKLSISSVILMVLSFYNLCSACGFDVTIPELTLTCTLLPKNVMLFKDVYNLIVSFLIGPNGLIKYLLPIEILRLDQGFHITNKTFVSIIAFLIDLVFVVPNRKLNLFTKLSQLVAWMIIGILSTVHFKSDVALYFETLEVFSSIYLTYIYGTMCFEYLVKSKNRFKFKHIKNNTSLGGNLVLNESDSDCLDVSKESFKTAVHAGQSPTTASSIPFNTAKKGKLNQHFSDLNIGALTSDIRPSGLQTNPFVNSDYSRPVPPSSNFGSISYKPDNILQRSDNERLNSSFYGSVFSHPNYHRSVSPMSARTEPVFRQNFNPQRSNSAFTPFGSHSSAVNSPRFIPHDNNPFKGEVPLNKSFQFNSPSCPLDRPTRTFLSPSKLNVLPSDGPNTKFWTNLNETQYPQRFVVNSLHERQYLSPINNIFGTENISKKPELNSRCSSTSSGFGSNGDFVRCLSESLPSSRENSPERSLLNSDHVYL